MKENIKLGLLSVIAVTLVINTFFNDKSPTRKDAPEKITPQSNMAAPNSVINPLSNTPTNPTDVKLTAPEPTPKLSETRTKTKVNFAKMAHNFGTIKQDTKNTKIFTFTNTGAEPLIIEAAKGSCGCTVPKYPKEPILPGKTGEIEVIYSPGKQQGAQSKTVTITANTDPITTTLNISATVETQE